MQWIRPQIDDPVAHLALDEALLLAADEGDTGATLRTWEFTQPVVVVGRASKIAAEVNLSFCESHGIPVWRRISGGAAVVAGPGCLMYSLVLRSEDVEGLPKIDVAHRYVMHHLMTAVGQQIDGVEFQGTCDLTWNNRKFSGNSLKISRHSVLYHGTILYNAPLDLLCQCLATAPRQPDYRLGRQHEDFVTNVPIDPQQLAGDMADSFAAVELSDFELPEQRIRLLCEQRYDNQDWHRRH